MKERFVSELAAGSLADAYLFVGASRTRLQEVALDCAAALLGARGHVKDHADFSLFDPAEFGSKGLKVENIAFRKEGVPCVETALRYRPTAGEFRALVLFDADRMTPDAQGALLKTTEEPPPGTILFFTAAELYDLSPALRSRCRIWRVPRLTTEELSRQAGACGILDEDWAVLLRACGSGEAILEMLPQERGFLLEVFPQVQAWLEGIGPQEDWCQVPTATKLAEKRHLGLLLLSAIRAWMLSAQNPPSLELLRFQATWCRRLDTALSRLSGQVTPELVFQDLSRIPS
ncbi:MAG: hypothetical protein ACYTEP_05440 [Planctomycetota bacterium]|jgi:hypothetical protein